MCQPVTLASISAASIMAGTAMKVSAASARGAAAQRIDKMNALTAEREAADAVARGFLPAVRARMHGTQFMGVQEAHLAASGVLVGVGSPGDVTRETRTTTDIDEEVIRTNAAREAFGYRTKAQAYYQQAAYAKAEADNEVLTSVIGGVGNLGMLGAKGWLDVPKVGEDITSDSFLVQPMGSDIPGGT